MLLRRAGRRLLAPAYHQKFHRCSGTTLQSKRWFSEDAAAAADTEAPPKTISPAVSALVDQIVALNLLEVSELVEELNTRLNLPSMPAGGMMMPMGGVPMGAGGAAPAAAEEEKKEEEVKAIVDIQLDSYDAAAKIKVIKEVKNLGGLGLKEAKAAVEGCPGVIVSQMKRSEAEEIIKTLEALGAKASMV